MKKLFTLLMVVAIAVTASAQVPFIGRTSQSNKVLKRENVGKSKRTGLHQKAPRRALGELITTQPEGEAKQYERSGFSMVNSWGTLYTNEQSARTTIVYDADGTTVYIKNIVDGLGEEFGESWVKGTLSDGGTKITVSLEQTVAWSYQYDVGIRLAWGKTVANAENTMVSLERDETVTEAVYVVDGNTIALQGTSGRTEFEQNIQDFVAEGLTCCYEDDGAWPGFLEWNTVLTEREPVPVPEVIDEQPEGELRSYVRSGGNIYQGWDAPMCVPQTGMTDVVFDPDGTTVYLRDAVFDVVSNAWIKGYLNEDGTKITVPTGQCIYWLDSDERGMMVYWMSTGVEMRSNENGEEVPVLTLTVHLGVPEVTYSIAADGTISLDNTVGDINADFPNKYVATGLGVVYSDNLEFCAMDFNTVYKKFQLVPAVPADPIVYEDSWFDSGEEDGYSCFDFKVLPQDVDGNFIDLTYTSYSIFTDDDVPFVFDAATYANDLTEDMTDIPYEIYNGGYDFDAARIYFYRTNTGDNPMFYNRIGIQVHYDVPVTDEDGVTTTVRNSSNIVYWDNLGTGISEVKSAPVVDDAYYNVMGQRFDSAAGLPAGIYIHQGKKVLVK